MHGYTRHFFTRAVFVGYHNRPGLIALRGRINWFLPCVLRIFWQIFVIADCALGTWLFTLVNRNRTGFWRVGVRLVWHHIDRYVHRITRLIWISDCYLPGCLTIISNIRCLFPRYLSALWEGRVFIIFILGYYDPGWGFSTLLDFHTAWHIRRLTSLSINQIRIRIFSLLLYINISIVARP